MYNITQRSFHTEKRRDWLDMKEKISLKVRVQNFYKSNRKKLIRITAFTLAILGINASCSMSKLQKRDKESELLSNSTSLSSSIDMKDPNGEHSHKTTQDIKIEDGLVSGIDSIIDDQTLEQIENSNKENQTSQSISKPSNGQGTIQETKPNENKKPDGNNNNNTSKPNTGNNNSRPSEDNKPVNPGKPGENPGEDQKPTDHTHVFGSPVTTYESKNNGTHIAITKIYCYACDYSKVILQKTNNCQYVNNVCKFCGHKKEEVVVPEKHKHDYSVTSTSRPINLGNGQHQISETHTCSNKDGKCDKLTYVTAHNESHSVDKVKEKKVGSASTCMEYTEECICGAKIRSYTTSNHSYTLDKDSSDEWVNVYECDNCGHIKEEVIVKPHNHSYSVTSVSKPLDLGNGQHQYSTTYTCSNSDGKCDALTYTVANNESHSVDDVKEKKVGSAGTCMEYTEMCACGAIIRIYTTSDHSYTLDKNSSDEWVDVYECDNCGHVKEEAKTTTYAASDEVVYTKKLPLM